MLRRLRLGKIHKLYLKSCRDLKEEGDYLARVPGCRRAFLEFITPGPVMGLQGTGELMLEALKWLEQHCRGTALSEEVIRSYHRMIWTGDAKQAGTYRREQAYVAKSPVNRPPPNRVPQLMRQLELKLAQDQRRWDESTQVESEVILRAAVLAHQRISFIHPFLDANGRTARLAMNHVMRRYGLGYIVLPSIVTTTQHVEVLTEAHRGNPEPLIDFAKSHLHPV